MTQPIKFAKDALVRLNGNRLSDHNRSELAISYERIESMKRMANGTMRKYVVADKRTFSLSWTELPHSSAYTVDGFWGAQEMDDFYRANAGAVTMTITRGDGTTTNHTVVISEFSPKLNKRGFYEFWDVSLSLEEV